MSCDKHEDLAALLDGELEGAEAERLRAHVDSCPHCREMLALLKRSYDALEHIDEVEVPEGLAARAKGRLRKRSLRPVLAAAAALLIAAVILFRVGFRGAVAPPPGGNGGTSIVSISDLTDEERAVLENMEILENYEILDDLELLAQFDTLLEFERFPDIEAI